MVAKNLISRIFSAVLIIIFILTVTPSQTVNAAGVRYAEPVSIAAGDCSSWLNACTLQTALTGAVSGDEVWVAVGTHKPTIGTDRTATFQLKDSVAVYGGFVGTESARDQRDPAVNVTILSGDIDNNDSQTPIITDIATVTGNTTNSYHVVTGATGATLDGFTITAGNANDVFGCPDANSCGGGMLNYSSSPTLTNLIFSGNSAGYGGGMWNDYSNPALTNVTFIDNKTAAGNGGGMLNAGINPTLTNVNFIGNTAAQSGGGMYNWSSSPTLMNVTFNGNTATNNGGGMLNESANRIGSSPTLTNVTFSGNSAGYSGGGMFNDFSSNPMLTNVTFNGNSATTDGGGMYNTSNSPTIRNTIFWSNTASSAGAQIYNNGSSPLVSDSVVQGGCPAGSTCTNIITADPLLGTLGNYGGFTQTILLLAGSSAIDTGNAAVCPATDQRGVSRPQGAHCDMGAYEYIDPTYPTVNAFIVTTSSNSLNIPITAYSASDDLAVTGYLITTSSTPPVAGAFGWTATAPVTYTVASDGSYTLYPWAKDAAGHVSAVFASPRAVVVDTIAPDTQIDTHPANPTNSANASFTFSSADSTAAFECSLEGGTFTACTNPKDYTGLPAGSHTFAVRARDTAGNIDASPSSYSWVIDFTAPTVVSNLRTNANPTSAASVSFTVTFSESVTGVGISDFSLTTLGISDASVTGVSGSGSLYTVTVNTGSGNGTIRLEVPVIATITDLAENSLSGLPYTDGETYTITKGYNIFLPLILR